MTPPQRRARRRARSLAPKPKAFCTFVLEAAESDDRTTESNLAAGCGGCGHGYEGCSAGGRGR
eukprot:63602-Prymnesium_polylepis.1